MKPLILNLLAEEKQAEHANARDPVKFAIMGAVVLVGVTLGIGVLMMMWAGRKQTQAQNLEKQWQKLTTSSSAGSFRQLKKFSDDLVDIHQKRVLLASQIALIKDIVPPTIHLTQMSFKLSMETAGGFSSITNVKSATKSQPVERLSLRLEGGAVGARPPIEVDSFLQAMRTDSVLSNQFQEVTLRSVGNVPMVSDDGKATQETMAQFVIECLYKEQK